MSDVLHEIQEASERYQHKTGKRATTIYIGQAVYDRFENHPLIVEGRRYARHDPKVPKGHYFEGRRILRVLDDPHHLRAVSDDPE